MITTTIKELKDDLNSLDEEYDDYIIILSSDAEGNSFSPLAGKFFALYLRDTEYTGEITTKEDYNYEYDGDAQDALVLFPVN